MVKIHRAITAENATLCSVKFIVSVFCSENDPTVDKNMLCYVNILWEIDTDGRRADLIVHETWWKPYVWQHPGELGQAGQRDETHKDRNGCEWRSALTHWP